MDAATPAMTAGDVDAAFREILQGKAPRMSADVGFVKLEEAIENTSWPDCTLEVIESIRDLLAELNEELTTDAERIATEGDA